MKTKEIVWERGIFMETAHQKVDSGSRPCNEKQANVWERVILMETAHQKVESGRRPCNGNQRHCLGTRGFDGDGTPKVEFWETTMQ